MKENPTAKRIREEIIAVLEKHNAGISTYVDREDMNRSTIDIWLEEGATIGTYTTTEFEGRIQPE